ncbi:hypothetical protein F4813DRAFT_343254 [Daldinia decipiens]|uniref:uncharacterized protein n=1 Tax=Daldinia decipiens TaxID=326647 RepID=UPI0020C2ABA7|nr:uncharacterized protein F4813DRAFT_343254 [Daldinia decipiens]KAI1662035.1 hypothetical protein F4813DRAFT_343254 [Daldinia decipiens]
MSHQDSNDQDKFFFSDEEDRPWIDPYAETPEFHVGDKVYLLSSNGSLEGPYLVASVPSRHKCTLSLENGQNAKNGEVFEMAGLQAA